MKKIMGSVIVLCAVCLMLSACGKEEEKKVSFETLETARLQANENSEYNARVWRTKNAPDLKIKTRGDSTQSAKCPQGDGWASIDLVDENGTVKIKLKCSTASAAVGCIEAKDFMKRKYAGEEGKCNSEIPFPLPKVVK